MITPQNIFSRRSIAAALLLFQVVFFNFIIPGHTRGVVTMGPKSAPVVVARACPFCAPVAPAKPGKDSSPTQQDREHCEICFFAAHLTLPPVFDVKPPALGLLDIVVDEASPVYISQTVLRTYDACAPPVIAAL